jgi:type VI secretion system (T6SS) effector TldE1-like protein
MARAVATVCEVPGFDRRVLFQGDTRRINRAARFVAGSAVTAATAAAAVGVFGAAVTLGAAFILNTGLAGNPHLRAPTFGGPAALALVEPTPGTTAPVTFEGKWAHIAAEMRFAPVSPQLVARLTTIPAYNIAHGLTQVARLTAPPPRIALPLPRPHIEPPVGQAAPRLAMALPLAAAIAERAPQIAHNIPPALPAPDGRTAVYDISAHTVYLPNGERLEAHSGLGEKMDNPQYTKVRMRGPTPPNVYTLTLREEIFHGVRAIRLNPVDEDKMHGRAGMLAHTYMLGPNGQSNGCVSFRDYNKFLRAFLKGQVDRMVVVAALPRPPRMASTRRDHNERYAAND